VRQEVLQRGEQERAEATLGLIDRSEKVAAEQVGKKGLGEVAGLVGVVAAAADVGAERKPVGLEQRFEGGVRLAFGAVTGVQHDPPLGGGKPVTHALFPDDSPVGAR
jgi:hypothetical protein